jgi:hypothetical protein
VEAALVEPRFDAKRVLTDVPGLHPVGFKRKAGRIEDERGEVDALVVRG